MQSITHQPPMAPTRIPPVMTPVEACAWCWPLLNPGLPYPEQWSSTCCSEHSTWILAQHAAVRAARQDRKQLQGVSA